MRLEDVDHRYSLHVEMALVQLAIVSYPKMTLPLRLQQGKDEKLYAATWDPLVHEGYFYPLSVQVEPPHNRHGSSSVRGR